MKHVDCSYGHRVRHLSATVINFALQFRTTDLIAPKFSFNASVYDTAQFAHTHEQH